LKGGLLFTRIKEDFWENLILQHNLEHLRFIILQAFIRMMDSGGTPKAFPP
jgi:hypothetical protein